MIRIFLLLTFSLAYTSCGFQPLLKHNQEKAFPHNGQKVVIQLTDGGGFQAYQFKKSLTQQLSYLPKFDDHTYLVKVKFGLSETEINYDTDATVSRSSSVVSIDYQLYRMGMSVPLHSGSLSNSSSFNIDTNEEFATISAQNASADRATIMLAEDTAREVMIYLKQQQTMA